MKKEIGLAISAGITLGLIIAFGIWRGNSLLTNNKENKKSSQTIAPQTQTPQTAKESPSAMKIKIVSPENLTVLTKTPVTLSGITNPKSTVVVSTDNEDQIIQSDDSGNFSADINLEGGINQIHLTSLNNEGESQTSELFLIYSSQFNQNDDLPGTSYIGTVTDISNSVIQIKNDSGDVLQVSPSQNAAFIDTRNETIKTIKSTEIAIGDYIVAMGYKDKNDTLASTRIIVTSAPESTKWIAFLGKVTNKEPNKLTIVNEKINKTLTITSNKIPSLSAGDNILVSGVLKDNNIEARTIKIIK